MNKFDEQHEKDWTIKEQIIMECLAMAKYALSSGLKVDGDMMEVLECFSKPQAARSVDNPVKNEYPEQPDVKHLTPIHEKLCNIIEPAKPRTILMLDQEERRHTFFKFLGVVPFVRHMMIASIISMALFILISLSPDVDNKPGAWNLFESSGIAWLIKEFFLLSAAALGASFNALFTANTYIVKGTFDQRYQSSYWVRFTLGIIAGMLLATFIPIEKAVSSDFAKPLLAMLGGFSANVVYQIFERLIDTVASMVSGSPKKILEVWQLEMKTRQSEKEAKNRFQVAADLIKVQDLINPDMKPEELRKQIGVLVTKLTGTTPTFADNKIEEQS
jgi:hypothetical protein